MVKYLIAFLLIPSLSFGGMLISGAGKALTCAGSSASWTQDTNDASQWYISDGSTKGLAQKVKNSIPVQICKVSLYLGNTDAACNCKAEIRSTEDKTAGVKYGSTSPVVSVPTGPGYVDFEWTSGFPNPSGDFYIHLLVDTCTAANIYWMLKDVATAYEDTNYDVFSNGIDKNQDFRFKGYRNQ